MTFNRGLVRQFRQDLPLVADDSPPISTYPMLLKPTAIHARLSAHCNLACAFCERESWKSGDKNEEQDMTEEVWARLAEAYLPYVQGAELLGLGEPTLAKLFPRAARDVVAAGKILYFATNGLFLDKQFVLDAVGDTPRVSISVDAGDAESYKSVRGGDWDRLVQAVTTFRKEKPNAFLHSQFTAATYNIDSFPAFVQAASDWGVQEIQFRWVQAHTQGREDVSLRWSKDRTEAALEAGWQISQKTGITILAERRSYSETAPNLTDTPNMTAASIGEPQVVAPADDISRLIKYMDFMPFDDPTCPITATDTTDQQTTDQQTTDQQTTDQQTTDQQSTGHTRTFLPVSTTSDGSLVGLSVDTPDIFDRNLNEVFRQPVVPLSAPEAPAAPTEAYTPAALISAWDGQLWSCFAQHVVGNAMTDDFATVIRNPRYQAFLQNRAKGNEGVLEEPWCKNCARTF